MTAEQGDHPPQHVRRIEKDGVTVGWEAVPKPSPDQRVAHLLRLTRAFGNTRDFEQEITDLIEKGEISQETVDQLRQHL